jgi:spore germination protein
MIIHTVEPNETIYSLAEMYGVSAERLMLDNQINAPNQMVVGESLAVMLPRETYVIQEGDSLESIAAVHGVTAMQILRNNPQLSDRLYLYPGDEIVIRFTDETSASISVNGYAFPFIDRTILRKNLPYLTYLTVFYYRITNEGDIVNIDDQEVINIAKAYGVAPIMSISTLTTTGDADVEAAHSIITDNDKQETLIKSVLDNMKAKGYYGLNIDMQNIPMEDKQLYVDFITNISGRVRQEGYYVIITLTPRTFPTETGIMYQGPEYATLGQLTDNTMLLSYEWGHAHSPQPALPITAVRALLDYSVTQIPAEKINIGLPTIGYVWQLPFIPGYTLANAITHDSALTLANEVGAIVQRDTASEAPYFTYTTDSEYIVWFRDVRSTAALLALVEEYGLNGIGIWNTMQFAPSLWFLVNAQFDIRKVDL